MKLPPVGIAVWEKLARLDPDHPEATLKTVDSEEFDAEWRKEFLSRDPEICIMAKDRTRMGDTFTQFAETLVPALGRLAVTRPEIISRPFDLRKDGDLLKVVDADMASEDIVWLEARLNEIPELRNWATMFNSAVVDAYGDREHDVYVTEYPMGVVYHKGVEGLENTVDRDVRFMSLIRALRDTDLDAEPFLLNPEPFKENIYRYAAIKVRDMVVPIETYHPEPGGGLSVTKDEPLPSLRATA